MNVSLNPLQGDSKRGSFTLPGATNLTGLECRMVKIANNSGVAQFALPGAVTDLALFVLASGDIAANDNWAEQPSTDDNFRVTLHGTCNPGDTLILSDPTASAGANAGKVEALASQGVGQYFAVGVAQEVGVDGQYVLARYHPRVIRVASADTLTALTFTTPTAAEVSALRTAVSGILVAQGLMA